MTLPLLTLLARQAAAGSSEVTGNQAESTAAGSTAAEEFEPKKDTLHFDQSSINLGQEWKLSFQVQNARKLFNLSLPPFCLPTFCKNSIFMKNLDHSFPKR